MRTIKKSTILILGVVLIGAFIYYRSAFKIFQPAKNDAETRTPQALIATQRDGENLPAGSKKVRAVITYDVPADNPETARFTVVVDKDGIITSVRTEDPVTNEASDKQEAFSQELTRVLQGKKLQELSAVDRIGKSSLTTKAFNQALTELKAQL